jgi:hypothetical protein
VESGQWFLSKLSSLDHGKDDDFRPAFKWWSEII